MRYHHLAHMKTKPLVSIGSVIEKGVLIGYVGKTGTEYDHCHYEIARAKPPTWTFYPVGMSKAWVEANYVNPADWIKDGLPATDSQPNAGLAWLQYWKPHNVYHPGKDINSLNDGGKPIYSPVRGRVAFVSSKIDNGWGWHIWIEELTNKRSMEFQAVKFTDDQTTFMLSGNSLLPFSSGDAFIHAGGVWEEVKVLPPSERAKFDVRWESPIIKATK